MTYEIYLVQYPIIFLFHNIDIAGYLKIIIMILIILLLSYIIHFSISFKKENKLKVFRYILFSLLCIISLYGGYKYIIAEDHTKEMKLLEEQLNQNEKMMQQKQIEYENRIRQDEDRFTAMLEDLENNEKKLQEMVTNLPVVGLGDSVMLGALESLYNVFPNGYFDAQISRTAYVANGILEDLSNQNMLGNPIVMNFGANGDCPESYKIEIMKICGDRKVFWLNANNDKDVHVNENLNKFASKYPNLYIIDWNSISSGHPEYFIADGIHLTDAGRNAYAKAIYDSIYKVYLDEYNNKKEQILNDYEQSQKNRITFYGNDILINAFEYLQDDFGDAKFTTNKDFNYKLLKDQITQDIENKTLTNKIVFMFDKSTVFSLSEYQDLIELCKGHEIYFLSMDNLLENKDYENVSVIDFYKEINSSSEYLMVDKIHLTEKGNNRLKEVLVESIKNN